MASRRPRLAVVVPADAGTPTVRVALYRRASTDEANQPYSLDAQDQRLRPYVAAHPGWEVVADYVERASGKDIEGRPQLQRLLANAAAGKFDLVLVARIDRWSRCLGDLIHSVEFLSASEVAFHSSTEHFDTTTPMGKLTLQMLGMFAEFERSLIIDRIVRGNAAKIAKGLPLTARVGYGLTVDQDGRVTSDRRARRGDCRHVRPRRRARAEPGCHRAARLAALHRRLSEGVRSGSVQVRKSLFTALVERIEVHDAEDIRPTFRLYDPAVTSPLDSPSSREVPGQRPERHGSGLTFSSRSPGWS